MQLSQQETQCRVVEDLNLLNRSICYGVEIKHSFMILRKATDFIKKPEETYYW